MLEEKKKCERCLDQDALKKERFCNQCRKFAIQEMKDAGYLQEPPKPGPVKYRDQDARENTHETKFGRD